MAYQVSRAELRHGPQHDSRLKEMKEKKANQREGGKKRKVTTRCEGDDNDVARRGRKEIIDQYNEQEARAAETTRLYGFTEGFVAVDQGLFGGGARSS